MKKANKKSELTNEGQAAFIKGILVYLGTYESSNLNKEQITFEVKDFMGCWGPNILANVDFKPTHKKFRLFAVGGEKIKDETSWQRLRVDELAASFGLVQPTFEMFFPFWKFLNSLKEAERERSLFSRFVFCHERISCGDGVCEKVVLVGKDLIISGVIAGPGHLFDARTALVYTLPC